MGPIVNVPLKSEKNYPMYLVGVVTVAQTLDAKDMLGSINVTYNVVPLSCSKFILYHCDTLVMRTVTFTCLNPAK